MPAQPHLLTRPQVRHAPPDGGNGAHHFMSGHQWKGGDAPLIVEHAHITVADAAVFDFDFNILVGQGARIILEGLQFATGRRGRVGIDHVGTSLGEWNLRVAGHDKYDRPESKW